MSKTMSTPSSEPPWVLVRAAADEALAKLPEAIRSKASEQLRTRARNVELELYYGDKVLTTVVVPVLDGPLPQPAKPFSVATE